MVHNHLQTTRWVNVTGRDGLVSLPINEDICVEISDGLHLQIKIRVYYIITWHVEPQQNHT
jgi:hypothetical protein